MKNKVTCFLIGHIWRKLPPHYFPMDVICIRCNAEKHFKKVDGYILKPKGYEYNGIFFNY